ncbi:hypothetical protein Nepgr_015060 [Nepenthes gracilis]|uniref:ENTH domain-containing protein n=1 Tax=Nepenthes gracilis TaxID=150966 RepID=A0AAD3SM86_NEPGR|nr:hypothetical protein Nepgr_015060 [Nepenthes gracilis]
MAWRRAIGIVKDHTSIGLAKVNNSSNSLSDLDVAIVKATRHEQYPAEEKYVREILSLTSCSRHYIGACVNTICQRLNKTKNWVVALKTLMLIQQLLAEGDPAYEHEIFFATRRGTRLLNLSDFRDTSSSNSWDYSAFVRTYALYLDERLEYWMQGRRRKHNACAYSYNEEDDDQEGIGLGLACTSSTPPVKEMKIEQILSKMQHLMQLLERFLATRPTGTAKQNRIVMVALYPIVRESFQNYHEITDILSILIDKFMGLEVPECVKAYHIFCRASKQFDELDAYYVWCKDVGIARSSEYPQVERITPKKLDLMDEFIRDKAANAYSKRLITKRSQEENGENKESDALEEDLNNIKALPPPEGFSDGKVEEDKKEPPPPPEKQDDKILQKEADLLQLGDDAVTSKKHGNQLALALFDGGDAAPTGPPPALVWEAFSDSTDWEMALVKSESYLPHQKASLGGGLDMLLLDGLYQQGATMAAISAANSGCTGSASSIGFGSAGKPPSQMLALPAPPSTSSGALTNVNADPFSASIGVAPPPSVQMADLEKKQRLLLEEQMMWQQYAKDGMQGQIGLANYQTRQQNMGGHPHRHGFDCGYSRKW